MGWLMNKINSWSSDKQHEEMAHFVDMLRAMDGPELGHVVAIATHMRHALELEGHNVLDPIIYTGQNVGFPLFLSRTIAEAQKQGRTQDAAALMVWLHTARAGVRLELRNLAREMWRQLERGFPHVNESTLGFERTVGSPLNTQGATQFPSGLTPNPV
jgi:hypothetical protein